jgi:DNA-binding PadR family transcriptional regulator
VSPVFRHGALRLYLLKLLDEQPRHGYEVISLLEDRFLGFYAPSAGTVYPRLAKLESEGLVEHEEADGRKVYRLTDAGREELARHVDELRSLEADLTRSVTDLAKDVRTEVRSSVRELRDELKAAAREVRRESRVAGRRQMDVEGIVDSLRSGWPRDDMLDLSRELTRFLSDVLHAARRADPADVEAARAALQEARNTMLSILTERESPIERP